jgi:branched-subunit amino acid transport protein AzlD
MESFENPNQKPMSVKDWLVTLLIMAIPIVGLVMLFIYAFGNNENVNKQNWAKAQLIMMAIIIALIFIVFLIFGSIFAATMAGNQGAY